MSQGAPAGDAPPVRPDVLLSLDCSGSMSGTDMATARDYLRQLVVDEVAGGIAINYGHEEWSSTRTGSCASAISVPLPVPDADTSGAVLGWLGCSMTGCPDGLGPPPYGGTSQALAFSQAWDHYQAEINPSDPEPCRKDIVLMLTDGPWNCSGDPCAIARALGDAGVSVVAVGHAGVPLPQL